MHAQAPPLLLLFSHVLHARVRFCLFFLVGWWLQVKKHVMDEHAKLNTTTKVDLYSEHGGRPWVTNVDHPNYVAGRKATKEVRPLCVCVCVCV